MGFETVTLEMAGAVATLTLNRPAQRNALNLAMCEELLAAFRLLGAADAVRVVLVRGAGPVFCAGADLKERTGKDEAWTRNRRASAFAAYAAIQACEKPTIAVAHGPLVGSGCEIATACDFVLASTAASFRYPEAVWGSVGATQRLPRIVGKAMAKELLFTGRVVGAEEARQLRLVNHVVEPGELEALVAERVALICKAFPLAVGLVKRCIDSGAEMDLRTAIDFERLAIDRCLADGEWRKGLQSFAERV